MKKLIALVNLRYKLDINFEQKESLGLGYLSRVLIDAGYEVDVIDAQFFDLEIDDVFRRLTQSPYQFIGFSLFQETVGAFATLHERMRQAKLKAHICLGGQFPSFTDEELLKKFSLVDSIVIGEGEQTLLDLVKLVFSGETELESVNGISYLKDGEVIRTPQRKLIPNLDSLPFPWRDVYYSELSEPGTVSAIISASRGCYAKCSFCSIQTFYAKLKGKRIRVRRPEHVVDEMEDVMSRYGIDHFFFADDNFLVANLVHKSWVNEFIDEIEARELKISFDMDCRVNDIDVELFKRLKKNGLNGVFLGIESFNQRTLDTLYKEVTVQENIDAIKLLKSMRVNVWMGFIMFDPFTTLDEIREDVTALDKIKYFKYINYDRPLSSNWLASILQLYNGTPVLDMMKQKHQDLLIKVDFGYQFNFMYEKTKQFYDILQQWKAIVKKMIQVDTLFLIRLANTLKQKNSAERLHFLSRRYMLVDRGIFLALLDAVDENRFDDVAQIVRQGEQEFLEIENEIVAIENHLAKERLGTQIVA